MAWVAAGGAEAAAQSPPKISTKTLFDGTVGLAYKAALKATGGVSPYSWRLGGGTTLPPGLTLKKSTGKISGTPTTTGLYNFTIQVRDAAGVNRNQDYTVEVGDPIPLVERISVDSNEAQANGDSGSAAVSSDGRFVAFTSFANNLAPGDTNGVPDIFLRDRACGATVRVSVSSTGEEGHSQSFLPALSSLVGNTIFVAYASDAKNLVDDDTNGTRDIFVTAVDVSGCVLTPVSTVRATVAADGTEGNGVSTLPSLSADGSLVAYHSLANTLAGADSNNSFDIYVTELQFSGGALSVVRSRLASITKMRVAVLGETTADIFSVNTIGKASLTLTPNAHVGRLVEIIRGTGSGQNRDITSNTATTLTVSPDWTTTPDATSVFRILTLDDQTADVFSANTLGLSTLTMTDKENVGRLLEIVAGTGAFQLRVVTENDATTFTVKPDWTVTPDGTSVFRLLRQVNATSMRGRISADGVLVGFTSPGVFDLGDANAGDDVFLHERATSLTTRESVDTAGNSAIGANEISAVSGDASEVLFQTSATNLIIVLSDTTADIFSKNTIGSSTLTMTPDEHIGRRVEIIGGKGRGQFRPIVGNDATTLTVKPAWDIKPDDTSVFRILGDTNGFSDLYLRDRVTPETTRVSLANDGSQGDGNVDAVAGLSGGGRLVAFASFATNMVTGDRNEARDIFLRDRLTPETRRLSLGMDSVNPNGESYDPALSLDGTTVAFSSLASNLVLDDTNEVADIFVATTGISDPPVIVVGGLPAARQGVAYTAALLAVGGTPPLFWTLEKGGLPPGLFLDSLTGQISGIPQREGRYLFTVLVIDADRPARMGSHTLTLVVEH